MPIGAIPVSMTADAAIAQFKAFESFTRPTRIKDGALVQAGDFANGAFTIEPKSKFDFIGNIGRRAESKTTNDTVRNIFLASVIKMFGGNNYDVTCLPPSIREAMKINDFDAGKPLSARRIRAVAAAINQHVESRAQQLENVLAGAGIAVTDAVKERIRVAVRACGDDGDVFAALLENPKAFLFGAPQCNDSTLLDNADVTQRVKDLAADVHTLRAGIDDLCGPASRKGKSLFAAVGTFPAHRDVIPLPKPLMDNMVAAVKQMKTTETYIFLDLHPGSPNRQDIGRRVNDLLDRILQQATQNVHLSGARTDFWAQGSRKIGYKTLIGNMIIAQLDVDENNSRKMRAELNGILRQPQPDDPALDQS